MGRSRTDEESEFEGRPQSSSQGIRQDSAKNIMTLPLSLAKQIDSANH